MHALDDGKAVPPQLVIHARGLGGSPRAIHELVRLLLESDVIIREGLMWRVDVVKLAATKLPIRGIDVCAFGICIDYFFNDDRWQKALPEMLNLKGSRVHQITMFPWGIPWPDLFRVRVEHDFAELAGGRVGP